MFGLTQREQRWSAEQRAAELLAGLATAAIQADAAVSVAKANALSLTEDDVRRIVREELARAALDAATREQA